MHQPSRFLRNTRTTTVALAALVAVLPVCAATPAESGYVGEYRGGSVDTVAQLALLDDNTYCFAFTGGALDMVAAGRWKAEGTGIRLQQVRQEHPLFPAFARQVDALGATVEFDFHGYTLSNARAPVFAVSADDKVPATLRPLFSEDNNNWSENYKLPPMPADTVRYFYLGDLLEDEASRKPPVVKVVQYRLEGGNAVRVGFDQLQAMPLMDQRAELRGEVLFLSGSRLGQRRPLNPDVLKAVRSGCIDPALKPGTARPLREGQTKPLEPVKTFTVSPSAIQGKPFFEATRN